MSLAAASIIALFCDSSSSPCFEVLRYVLRMVRRFGYYFSHIGPSGVIGPGIEPGSPWWEASTLTAQPPWLLGRAELRAESQRHCRTKEHEDIHMVRLAITDRIWHISLGPHAWCVAVCHIRVSRPDAHSAAATDCSSQAPAAATDYSQQAPAAATDYSPQAPAAATDYSPQALAAATDYSPQAPAADTDYSPQAPAAATDYSPQAPAPATDYSTQAPAAATHYSAQAPAAATDYSAQVPADAIDYSPHAPAAATDYSPQATADAIDYSPQAPAAATDYSPQAPAPATDYSTQAPAAATHYSAQAPEPATDYSPQAPAAATDYSPQAPAAATDYSPQAPAAATDCSPQAPEPATDYSPQAPAAATDCSPQAPAAATDYSPQAPAAATDCSPQAPAVATDYSPQAPAAATDYSPQAPAAATDYSPQVPMAAMVRGMLSLEGRVTRHRLLRRIPLLLAPWWPHPVLASLWRVPGLCIDTTLTRNRYIADVLEAVVGRYLQCHYGASVPTRQRAIVCSTHRRRFLDDHHVALLPWPASSPDLSPMGIVSLVAEHSRPQRMNFGHASKQHGWRYSMRTSDTNRLLPRPLPDFHMWESCRTMPLVDGFSWGYPVSPALAFRLALAGSDDVKSTPDCDGLAICGAVELSLNSSALKQQCPVPAERNKRTYVLACQNDPQNKIVFICIAISSEPTASPFPSSSAHAANSPRALDLHLVIRNSRIFTNWQLQHAVRKCVLNTQTCEFSWKVPEDAHEDRISLSIKVADLKLKGREFASPALPDAADLQFACRTANLSTKWSWVSRTSLAMIHLSSHSTVRSSVGIIVVTNQHITTLCYLQLFVSSYTTHSYIIFCFPSVACGEVLQGELVLAFRRTFSVHAAEAAVSTVRHRTNWMRSDHSRASSKEPTTRVLWRPLPGYVLVAEV
ncbi:hypothetical protein PR048_025723 [Dryococelus australis]|uniref:Uncharacterized protein n=1 Tax=Dryococelus australis TaxID=614101 RepID=A0ABQ9GJ89_9NEOP|nr:hypothetical protein PR048_025723 [Dryococelus australis]